MSKSAKERDETYPFIKKLAANDRPTRDEALESLTKFLKTRRSFELIDLQKLWKGLYFSMWHSDRPKTQQRLADDLAGLLQVVDEVNFKNFLLAFWTIMAREWDGIDKHRIDKFYLLLRRYVGASIKRIEQEGWSDSWVEMVVDVMQQVPLNSNPKIVPSALPLHMFDIYLDEIEKVIGGGGEDEEEVDYDELPLSELIQPIKDIATNSPLKLIRNAAKKYVLDDPRLITWGVVEVPDNEDGDEEDDDDDEEWGGIKD